MASLIISDLDGTLYESDGDDRLGFTSSRFYKTISTSNISFSNKFKPKGRR
jgi:hypothetical protein